MTASLRIPHDHAGVWPFNWLSLYSHMAQDFGRCAQTLAQCTDAMEAMRAEGVLAIRLMDDLAQAYADLAATPWTVMATALVQQGAEVNAAEIRPFPARAGDGVSRARSGPSRG